MAKYNNRISKGKVSVEIDYSKELDGLSQRDAKKLKDLIGITIIDAIQDRTTKQNSVVTGKQWKGLSKGYKKFKGAGSKADLLLKGDMLNDLRFDTAKKDKVELKITESTQKKKAFNHITGDTLPKRQFLPNKGEKFSKGIETRVNKVIKDFKDDRKDKD